MLIPDMQTAQKLFLKKKRNIKKKIFYLSGHHV